MLDIHLVVYASRFAPPNAGKSNPARIAITAMTTSNSINVNAARFALRASPACREKMKANRPSQSLIPFIKAASDQIADHGQEFIEILPLRRHFRIVTNRHQHV